MASLAHRLAMSRSTFAARFKELVGEPPQRYFTRLRIDAAAAARLRTGVDTLSAVAAGAGYRSAAAFAKSFKRHFGTTPGCTGTSAPGALLWRNGYRKKRLPAGARVAGSISVR